MATSRLSTRRVDWRVQVGTSNKPGQGLVIFEASVSYIPDPLAAGGPRTAIPEPVAAVLDSGGYACTPDATNPAKAGERGVDLFTTDSLGEDGGDWTWTARPQLRSVNGIQMTNAVPAFSFAVPTGTGSLDLAKVQKVPASPGLGTEAAVALVARAEKAAQDAKDVVGETVGLVAQTAVGEALEAADLVRGSDERLPSHEENVGLSVALTDARGNRTHLEADDVSGAPTDFSLSLTGPALRDYMDFMTSDDERIPGTQDVPGLSVVVTDARGRMTWMRANDTNGNPPPETVEILREALALGSGPQTAIISAGDSITQGGHGGGPNWQAVLSGLLGVPVANTGVSGCTALEITIKQGSWAPVLTVTGGVVPAEAGTRVPVTLDNMPAEANWWSASGQPARTYQGTFEGVPAVLTKTKENTWTLHRTATGPAVAVVPRTPFLVIPGDPSATWILWPGRNDYPKSNMRAAVNRMTRWIRDGGGHFLILSTLTRTGEPLTYNDSKEVLEQNRITQEDHPYEYVNMRDYLVLHGMKTAGVTPTEADLAAQAVGGLPPSLMADGLHPNEAGRLAIGTYLYEQLKARNLP